MAITDSGNEVVDGSAVPFVIVAFVLVYSVGFVKLNMVMVMIKVTTLPKIVQNIVNRPKAQFSE